MQRRGRQLPQPLRDRIERVRRMAGGHPTAPASGRRRRVSRREREARRQRQLRWGIGIAAGLAVLVLIVAAVNDYFVKPRTVLASVNGTEIRRRDYWKVRSINLIEQANQYQQIAGFVQGEQQTQYLQAASQARQDLEDVWGSTDVDDATLEQMIDDQVYLQNLGDLNLEITEQDVDDHIAQRFGPAGTQITEPTATPTLIPTRAAWATATAAANETATASATAAARAAAPAPTSATLPLPPGIPPPPLLGSPGAGTPPAASPGAGTPTTEPTTAATPGPAEARSTAEAAFDDYADDALDEARMSRADYETWVVRPTVAREKVRAALEAEVGQTAEQVHAAHILVSTQDLAREIHDRLQQPDADFAAIAREESTDEATAGNGGDLGWFTRAQMVDPFAEVAFSLPPGETSEPFQTEFGWHIVTVFAHEQDRPLTDEQITQVKEERVQQWLDDQKAEMDIDADIEPTPTPFAQPFQPPADAPPPPTPTPIPSPAASPVTAPAASPVASPVGTPTP